MTRTLVFAAVLLFGFDSASGQSRFSDASTEISEAQIERILGQKRDMVFQDATLADLAGFLIASGIPTFVDQRSLDDVGVGTDSPVSFRQHAILLRDGLKLALRPHGLTWTVREGRLIITTPEEEEAQLITRVYDVRHLVEVESVPYWSGYGGEPVSIAYYYDFDSLIETITSSIEPDSWEEVGGPGNIEPYRTRRMRVIVVSQTYDAHWQLKSLLDELAKHGGTKPLSLPPARASGVKTSLRAPSSLIIPTPGSIRSSQLRTTGQ